MKNYSFQITYLFYFQVHIARKLCAGFIKCLSFLSAIFLKVKRRKIHWGAKTNKYNNNIMPDYSKLLLSQKCTTANVKLSLNFYPSPTLFTL